MTITPAGGTFSTATQSVTIDWCGHAPLDPSAEQIVFNGVNVTASFSYVTSAQSGCSSHATSSGTITIPSGGATLSATIQDNIAQSGTNQAYFTLASSEGVAISLAPQNGTNRDVSLCVANCFDQVITYSTPSYRSMDQDRSLTLVYRSSHERPIGTITLDVRDTAAGKTASQLSLQILDANGAIVTQRNGLQETFFTNQPGQTLRIAGQFDASGLTSNSWVYSTVVKSYYTDGTTRTTTRSARVLVVNERSSPYGVGWSVAGLQRLYPEPYGGSGVSVVDGAGSIQYFAGPCAASPCSYTAPAGDFTTLSRSASGGWDRRYPDGTIVHLDASGYETSSQDRFGNTTSFAYSGGRLSSVTDPVGQAITIGSGAMFMAYYITDPAGRVTRVAPDAGMVVSDILDPAGGHPFAYSVLGYAEWTDRRGGIWDASFDCSGHLSTMTAPSILVSGAAQRPQTQFRHVDMQTTGCATGAGTSASPYTATLAANVTASTTDARSYSTTYVVDAFLAPTRITDPLGRVTSLTRDLASHVTNVTTQSGHSITTYWTGPNATTVIDNTTGRTINYEYDLRYNVLTSVSGHTASVQNYLNAAGTAVDSTRVAGTAAAVKYFRDASGRDTLRIDPLGHATKLRYALDLWHNLYQTEVPGGRLTTFAFDAAGRTRKITDAVGDTSVTVFDDLNRKRQVIGPRGDVTTFAYDSLFLLTVTDPIGQVYRYDRNALGWAETVTDPGSRIDRYTYDANGNVLTKTNRRGQAIGYTYDAVGRPTQLNTDPQRSTTWSYDPGDRWIAASNSASTDTIQLDVAGRVVAEVAWRGGHRLVTTSTYNDTMGVRASVGWAPAPNHFAQYGYNAAYELASLYTNGAYTYLGYNNERMLTSLLYPNGTRDTITYTSTHAVASRNSSAAVIDAAFYTVYHRDSLSRISQRYGAPLPSDGDTVRSYSFDPSGQLTRYWDHIMAGRTCYWDPDYNRVCGPTSDVLVAEELYNYDLAGNGTDIASVDPGNRVRNFHGFALSYDPDGNLVRKVKAGVADDSLMWNALGELTAVLRAGSSVAQFAYDGFGRRVAKTGSGVTNYQWDGTQIVAEWDGSWGLVAEYAFYPASERLHSVTAGGSTYIAASDGSGNVIGFMSASGVGVAAQYRYNPFGKLVRNDGGVPNSLRFQGRPYDPETGLYYFRARYYDPDLNRFVSEDPIGLDGGINVYQFAGNDPLNAADPWGLRVAENSRGSCSIMLETCGGVEELENWMRSFHASSSEGGSFSCYVGGDASRFATCMQTAAAFLGTGGTPTSDPQASQWGNGQFGMGELQQNGSPGHPRYRAAFVYKGSGGEGFEQQLAANVTLDDRPGVIATVNLKLSGYGIASANYEGTLTFAGNVYAATLKIIKFGQWEFGRFVATPKTR